MPDTTPGGAVRAAEHIHGGCHPVPGRDLLFCDAVASAAYNPDHRHGTQAIQHGGAELPTEHPAGLKHFGGDGAIGLHGAQRVHGAAMCDRHASLGIRLADRRREIAMLPAPMVEDAVIGEIHRMIRAPEITARTIAALRRDGVKVDEAAVVATLAGFERLWGALYPAEQARIIQLLVERITVGTNGIAVDLRKEGLGLVLRDMLLPAKEEAFA